MEILLVRRQVLESIGRAQFVLAERNVVEPGPAAIGPAPFGQGQSPVDDFGNLEFFVILLVSTPVSEVRFCRSPGGVVIMFCAGK
jgi:hypothetical protein